MGHLDCMGLSLLAGLAARRRFASRKRSSVGLLAAGSAVGPNDEQSGCGSSTYAKDLYNLSPERFAQLMLNVAIPALLLGTVAFNAYIPMSLFLRTLLAPTTLAVMKDDMTQFTQNAFALELFLLGLVLELTFEFLLRRQEALYNAIYAEVSETKTLIEQLCLLGSTRYEDEGTATSGLLQDVESYLTQDLQLVGEPDLLPIAWRSEVDPLEKLMFATSVGLPSCVYDSVRAIRQARAGRLAAVQRRFPIAHYVFLGVLAVLTLGSFVLLGAGTAGFEKPGEAALYGHLLGMQAPLFGFLVISLSLVGLSVWQLSDPQRGIFGVQGVLESALGSLLDDIRFRSSTALRGNESD